MADVAVNPSALVLSGELADPTGTTVGAADFGVVTRAATAAAHLASDAVDVSRVVLRLSSVTGASPAATVLAGVNPPANRNVLGDLEVDLGAGETKFVTVDSSRFVQNDGTIRIDSGVADLVVAVLELPRGL